MTKILDHHRFVFICGLHRSGTTLMQRCLMESAEISGFEDTGVFEDEGQYLQSVYPIETEFGGTARMAFDPRIHMTEDSPLVSDRNREQLFREWSRYWDLSKSILAEKTPSNIFRTRFLQAVFPRSYFIVLTRHPIAASLGSRKWSYTGLYAHIDHWLRAHELFDEDTNSLKRLYRTSYERLVRDSDKVLAEIAEFLEVEPWRISLGLRRGINDAYFGEWERMISPAEQRDRELANLYPRAVRQIAQFFARKIGPGYAIVDFGAEAQDSVLRFESRVRRFGYSLVDLQRIPEW